MRFNRRQLLACCLAFGVIGLVATADSPAKTAAAPAKPAAPSQWVVVAEPVSLEKPVPASLTVPAAVPVKSEVVCKPPVPVLMLPTAEPPVAVKPVMVDAPPLPLPVAVALPEIKPVAVTAPVPDLLPSPPTIAPPVVETPKPVKPFHVETPKIDTVVPAPFRKVTIDYSTKPLRFEVQAGDVALKVECETIDVRMPGEKDTTATPLKATGHVKFTAPGCSGVCDEIVIYTAAGEAVLHGNVKLRCRQGTVETEVAGTNVKFKLWAAR
jgi:hypothetical protein